MGASLPLYSVTDMPVSEEISMGLGKSGRNRIDAMIRKGVMPNVAGHPTMDASTGMANGVKRAIPKQAPASLKTKLLKGGVALAAGGAIADAAANDSTARYAQRFGVSEPTGDGSMGDMAKFALLRAGGFASDVGNNLLLGIPGNMFYRDRPGSPLATESLVNAAELTPATGGPGVPAAVSEPVPQAPVPNPATPEQQSALRNMGITQAAVANHGAGVDMGTAQQIERQGKYGGTGGQVYQLSGMGDQNSVYAKASKPGGRINEFYGAGTGKESSPGSMRLNVMSSQGVMAPDSSTTGAVSAALKAAADRGDWGAVENFYAKQGQGFGGKTAEQIQGSDLRSQLAEAMAMPTNTFGQIAAKRAAFAAINKGIQIADLDSRNNLAQGRNAMDMARFGLEVAGAQHTLADKRKASQDKQAAEDAAVALAMERNPAMSKAEQNAVRRGVITPFKDSTYKVEYGDVTSAFGTPAVDAEGKPVSDPFTGRQVVNRDIAKERAFFQWMKANNITDTNKGLALYLGKNGGGAGPSLQNVTQADITATAKKHGITEAEVRKRLGL